MWTPAISMIEAIELLLLLTLYNILSNRNDNIDINKKIRKENKKRRIYLILYY